MAPWDVLAEDVAAGRLAVLLPVDNLDARSAYGIVSHAGRSLSPAARAMVEYLLEEDAQPITGY